MPGGGQARDAGANHRNAAPHAVHCSAPVGLPRAALWEGEEAVQRPETNQGGREEEEKGLRISLRGSEGLHGAKQWNLSELTWPTPSTAKTLSPVIGMTMAGWRPG